LVVIWYLGLLEWTAGRWQRALEHTTTARELGEHISSQRGWYGRVQALVEADLGLVEQARASAEDALAFSRAQANEAFELSTLGVLGRLELMCGDLETAGSYLRELPGRLLAGGANDPTNPVWADSIETLIALGELEWACSYLERYELHTNRLGSPLAREGVLRCRGLLAAAKGDIEAAFEAFEPALSERPERAWPFERARTLLCLGTVRRQTQQKRAARAALEQALAVFEELGARLWAEKARAELRRISGRRAPSEELTESELRVAELASQGRTNKEIAAELYMGVSTVEAHLSRVYRKLGIGSRAELGRWGANERDEAVQA
jgi:DNA-binding CsgD family transcriptional regulator